MSKNKIDIVSDDGLKHCNGEDCPCGVCRITKGDQKIDVHSRGDGQEHTSKFLDFLVNLFTKDEE